MGDLQQLRDGESQCSTDHKNRRRWKAASGRAMTISSAASGRRPAKGRYFTDKSPVDGSTLCEVARSDAADVEPALDAAHAAKDKWARTSPTERAKLLNKIADRIEDNLELLAQRRDARQRQADPRDDECGRAAVGRSLPLFRRLHPRGRGNDRRDRPRHGRLSLPRAARRGRSDHPVELPAA